MTAIEPDLLQLHLPGRWRETRQKAQLFESQWSNPSLPLPSSFSRGPLMRTFAAFCDLPWNLSEASAVSQRVVAKTAYGIPNAKPDGMPNAKTGGRGSLSAPHTCRRRDKRLSLQVSFLGSHKRKTTDGEGIHLTDQAGVSTKKEYIVGCQKIWHPASQASRVSFSSSLKWK